MPEKILIGSHIGMSAPDYFLGSVKEAISYGETTFMFYTGAPQNSIRKPLDQLKIEEGLALLKESDIDADSIIVHAPYIINLANIDNDYIRGISKDFLVTELKRVAAFGSNRLVLHPGAKLAHTTEEGLNAIVSSLDEVFEKDGTNVRIALETMAGKGSEVGISFEEIAYIISHSKHPERLGVCLDTCHINDAGYDVHDVDGVLDEFDKIIGLEKLLAVHLNDSKNERGAHKDRHENVGFGSVGFETLYAYVHNPRLKGIPKVLETPYVDEKPPYKREIEMLLSGSFDPSWREKL